MALYQTQKKKDVLLTNFIQEPRPFTRFIPHLIAM